MHGCGKIFRISQTNRRSELSVECLESCRRGYAGGTVNQRSVERRNPLEVWIRACCVKNAAWTSAKLADLVHHDILGTSQRPRRRKKLGRDSITRPKAYFDVLWNESAHPITKFAVTAALARTLMCVRGVAWGVIEKTVAFALSIRANNIVGGRPRL